MTEALKLIALCLHNLSIKQADGAMGYLGIMLIMRYHDDGVSVFLVYRLDQLQDFLGGIIIQGSCRLIAEKNVRILHNGTADSSPLLLTAGKLIGEAFSDVHRFPAYGAVHLHPAAYH